MSVLGRWPMAMNTPSTARSVTAPVFTCRSFAPVTPGGAPSPSTSSSTVSQTISTLSLRKSRSWRIFSALRLSRRWTTETLLAWLVR